MKKEKYEKGKIELYKIISSWILKEKPPEDIIRLILNKSKEILHSEEGNILLDDFSQIIRKERFALRKDIEKENINSVIREVIKKKKGLIKNAPLPFLLSPIKEKDRIEGIIYLMRKDINSLFTEHDLEFLEKISSKPQSLTQRFFFKERQGLGKPL